MKSTLFWQLQAYNQLLNLLHKGKDKVDKKCDGKGKDNKDKRDKGDKKDRDKKDKRDAENKIRVRFDEKSQTWYLNLNAFDVKEIRAKVWQRQIEKEQ